MTAKKKTAENGPSKNDGNDSQICKQDLAKSKKNAVKYTLWRSKEDIENIAKVRRDLISNTVFYNRSLKTDSEIYKKLPDLYLNAVKKNLELINQVNELTAKLDELEDLRACFCRIFELCEMKK